MKEKKKNGLESPIYAAPHAESVKLRKEGLLCALPSDNEIQGDPEGFSEQNGSWG